MLRIDKETNCYELNKKLDRYNSNSNDGFDLLKQIVNHPNCELGTALKAFYMADGEQYLLHRIADTDVLKERLEFIKYLYDRIINGCYISRFVGFKAPLSKVQKYKLLKAFPETPTVFLKDIAGSKTVERCEQCFVFCMSDNLVKCRVCKILSLRITVVGSTYSIHCDNCGYGLATTCIRPCHVNDTMPRVEFSKYKECRFKV